MTDTQTIDTGFVRACFDASYLLLDGGRAAFIDCGTNHSVPHLLDALAAAGIAREAVDWLILTHVHLDHAGGAGSLLAELPAARLLVHPRGARHMIDPARLWASASAVYGEAVMEASYGRLRPIPAARVVTAEDGHEVAIGTRVLTCLHTPGHARHHMALHDAAAGICFTGDTFGLSYRELDSPAGPFMVPTTSPVEFDPDALHASIDRLLALAPRAMYLTHYGPVAPPARLGADLHAMIDAMVALARVADAGPDHHATLTASLAELYANRAAAHGWPGSRAELERILAVDIELNAQGLGVWLDRLRQAGGAQP